MKIEVTKEFKDSNGNKREEGETIDTSKDDGVSEETVSDLISKGFATEKLEEKEIPKIEIEDVYVKSYTEWWLEIADKLCEERFEEIANMDDTYTIEALVSATNTILQEVGRSKRQDKIGNQKQEKKETNKNKKQSDSKASEKQRNYLDSLGVDYENDINRDMASDLIERELDKQDPTSKQKNALKKADSWEKGMSKKEASEKLDEIYSD